MTLVGNVLTDVDLKVKILYLKYEIYGQIEDISDTFRQSWDNVDERL